MPGRKRVVERNQLSLERLETRTARATAAAYNQARRELVASLLEGWAGTTTLTPGEAADLLRRSALLNRIDARLLELEREAGVILRDAVRGSSELALEQVQREMALLPRHLRPGMEQFGMIDTRMIERFVPQAIDELQAARTIMGNQLRRELQSGLLQGESFPNLVRRLMAATPTGRGPAVWRNGQNSANLLTRRLVITANNAAKEETYREVNARGGTQVQKQAIAVIGSRTTETCLRVHGQIRDIDQPFRLTGEPRFADEMMGPAFHWNCRTSIGMYHPVFEQGGLTTANMTKSARAQLRRNEEQRKRK